MQAPPPSQPEGQLLIKGMLVCLMSVGASKVKGNHFVALSVSPSWSVFMLLVQCLTILALINSQNYATYLSENLDLKTSVMI